MPVLLPVLPDPTDFVMQGESMRVGVVDPEHPVFGPMAAGSQIPNDWGNSPARVADEDAFLPMNSFIEINRASVRRQKNGELQMRANAGVATTMGAWVYLDFSPLLNPLLFATPVLYPPPQVNRHLWGGGRRPMLYPQYPRRR